jgi:UDP-N-acetyl-L-fucosamine synthase
MREVLTHYADRMASSDVLARLGLAPEGYFLVSAHREENVDDPGRLAKLAAVLNALAADHGLPIIVSTHPRTMKRIEAAGTTFDPCVRLLKPLGFHDYVHLQTRARAVLSDSGTLNEEASILNFPALNLRDAHERPEGMEEAVAMLVGLEPERVRQGLAILATQPRGDSRGLRLVADYEAVNVSDKVVRIIHSYTDYVRRVVWRQSD